MSTYLVKNKFTNILINNETGKWLAFKTNDETSFEWKHIKNNNSLKAEFGNKFASLLMKESKIMEKPVKRKFNNNFNCLVINVTNICNMQCKYCYANNEDCGQTIEKDTITTSIKKFAKYISPNNLTVIFHGGEPLLAFDVIKSAVEELQEIKNIKYSIQTNGTLLTTEKLEFFKKHNFLVGLSIDGVLDRNNYLRNINNKISNYTINNLKLLKKHKIFVKPLLVIHKENINDIKENVDYFFNNGADGLVCNLLWDLTNNHSVMDSNILFENMKYILDKMLENYDGEEFDFSERNMRLLFRKVVYGFIDEYMCGNSPCGAGKETVAVDYNGNIYGCNVLISNEKESSFMGNIFRNNVEDILKNKIQITNRNLNNIEKCKNCPYKVLCGGGGCCGFIKEYTNNIDGLSIYCDYYLKIITYIIDSVLKLNDTDLIKNY